MAIWRFLVRRLPWQISLPLLAVVACSLAVAQSPQPSGSAANVPSNNSTTAPPAAEAPQSSQSSSAANSNGSKPVERLREGTRLTDVVGTFQSVGNDNVSFSLGGNKDSFRVLENLALQRINQVLDENRGPRQWIVSGLITEYRGSNYILVTKAVIDLKEGDSATNR